ncbi:Sir2 family NAD-dependent protein deacetylase [Rothia aerolata]|uniref:protein acetyllysine N-acetyltransferase n=1 Tax=Rothia aerolata TaxID=1812262 RepID=A0A917ISI7_9MICC|nr:NAD-dependent protein deacetylase [Rothia aerolata]
MNFESSSRASSYVSDEESLARPDIAIAHRSALRSIERVVAETAQPTPPEQALAGISDMLNQGGVLVLTGAGVSTASGIPDYRGPAGSLKKHRPMTYQEFRYDDGARQRYWARSYVGWRRMRRAEPNAAHYLLAKLEQRGALAGLITQNVDGLHQRAGSKNMVALHGDLDRVICLMCGNLEDRASMDSRMEELNPGYLERLDSDELQVNPDGDVELDDAFIRDFVMVGCQRCGSTRLKPDVVYFGESVPADRKAKVAEFQRNSESLLIVGSSVAVMSGFKLAIEAGKKDQKIGIINGGPGRADSRADYLWRSDVSAALAQLI